MTKRKKKKKNDVLLIYIIEQYVSQYVSIHEDEKLFPIGS